MSASVPTSLPFAAVDGALSALGLAARDLREVVIDPRRVTVRYARRDAEGSLVAADESIAEVTFEIGIVR